jgi:hypothetical protein
MILNKKELIVKIYVFTSDQESETGKVVVLIKDVKTNHQIFGLSTHNNSIFTLTDDLLYKSSVKETFIKLNTGESDGIAKINKHIYINICESLSMHFRLADPELIMNTYLVLHYINLKNGEEIKNDSYLFSIYKDFSVNLSDNPKKIGKNYQKFAAKINKKGIKIPAKLNKKLETFKHEFKTNGLLHQFFPVDEEEE